MEESGRPEDLVIPPNGTDLLLTVLCALGGAMAASSGVGGGVIFVPLLVLIANLPMGYAAPVSNFVIAVSAVCTFVINLFETHPKNPSRPLINFEALIYFVPIAVSSTSLGVMMSKALAEWLVNILLFVFLGFTSYRMLKRAKKVFDQEKSEASVLKANSNDSRSTVETSEGSYLLRASQDAKGKDGGAEAAGEALGKEVVGDAVAGEGEAVGPATTAKEGRPREGSTDVEIGVLRGLRRDPSYERDLKLRSTLGKKVFTQGEGEEGEEGEEGDASPGKDQAANLLSGGAGSVEASREESRPGGFGSLVANIRSTRWWYWLVIFGSWGIQVFFSVLQKKAKSCTLEDFALMVGQPAFGVVVGLTIARLLIERFRSGKQASYEDGAPAKPDYEEGDIVMGESWRQMMKMMAFCLCIGALGGLLGVGGGSILAPMLLELGASAVVTAPISSSLVLFSSSQAAVQYAVGGKLLWNYAIWLGGVNLVANYVGLYAVKQIVARLGYTSFIIGSLGVLLVAATTFTAVFMGRELEAHGFSPFPQYCRA
ncbi:hypothetical protein HOP50_02g10450 [Chloropicon primus]|uniref:Sulfite exporter TauE/SafE n=1 Tax=Chloropicon primus TaxID=1764295 RepID=A0A5B8ME52_9CHLO|nr:hypothetical protein A3770_02p10590 [Chloropicon primus]UPQ97750.1 hypothetical protein HOP50_02g10450 [Chloropicon primus]|eukprot:QDZ18541.1 hypothetical protein A3770_02p10590 [Chloropicon primus]